MIKFMVIIGIECYCKIGEGYGVFIIMSNYDLSI